MRETGKKFVAPVMFDDCLTDDRAERGHARREPRRDAAVVKWKISASGSTSHGFVHRMFGREPSNARLASADQRRF